jgi:retron-type reverse transcriptase
VRLFEWQLEDNIFSLHEQLQNGVWRHGQYKQFIVCDPKPRIIHKATVVDRLLHHAITRLIEPIFERSFIFDSWSCRRDKGTHYSVERCHQLLFTLGHNNHYPVWILKGDIKKYFASINHNILLDLIKKKIDDVKVVALIANIVESFPTGVPLGNLTSQLFANIYLNNFDHFIKEQLKASVYLRYSDDFIIAHHSRDWILSFIPKIQSYLSTKLKLTLHPHKIIVRPFHQGIDWLGYVLYPNYRLLRPKTKKRVWKKINQKMNDYLGGTVSLDDLKSLLASYHGLFKCAWSDDDRRLEWLGRCL